MPAVDRQAEHSRSIEDRNSYWGEKAVASLDWFDGFDTVSQGSFIDGDVAWFVNGKLNACYNAVDRHVETRGDQTAIIWEGDEPGETKSFTYKELLKRVCQIANAMRAEGVKRGDAVTIYMPMMPEVTMVMLACARIGAIHSVIFAGFSADAIAERIAASGSKWVFTSDEGLRGGKKLPLKNICDAAMSKEVSLADDANGHKHVTKKRNTRTNEGRNERKNE